MLPKFVNEGLMEEVLNVFGIVEGSGGGRGFRRLLLVPRLTRVNS